MNDPIGPNPPDPTEADEARLAEKVAELAERLRRGESIDQTDDNSFHADELRGLLPTMRMLGELSSPMARETGLGSLGDFRILREAGRGGMGIVYEAVQVSLDRRVALKVLLEAAALDPRHVQRFHVEARAAASLHHPHIVPVFAIGSESGILFYAMQFIEGRNLARVIEGQAKGSDSALGLTRDRIRGVAELGRQAAEALAYAHDRDVLHRDIKPSNLLLDAAGHLWITDFGLARIQGDLELTRTGDHLGTPRYMSPEQALGRATSLDGRTDIYSLGATLYELLTLRPAFDGEDRLKLLRQIADDEPISPRRIDPRIPVDLETIVLKAMAKDPNDRYRTAAELSEDLQRFLDDRPIRAKRPTLQERAAKWARRNRPIVSAGIIAALVILVALTSLGIWSIVWLQQYNVALRREVERADTNARLARRHLLAFELRQAKEFLDTGEIERAQNVLDAVEPGPDGRDPRGFAWHYLNRQARREIIQLRTGNPNLYGFALSPDGRTIATRDIENRIELWNVATQSRQADLTGTDLHAIAPSFSPDGRWLAAIETDGTSSDLDHRLGAVVWDVASGRLLARVPTRQNGPPLLLAGFVREHTLGLHRGDDWFTLWGLESDSTRSGRVGSYFTGIAAGWEPGGGVIIREGDRLRVADVEAGTAGVELEGVHGSDQGVWGWSEDGRMIASAFVDGRVILWEAATGAERERYRADPGRLQQIVFSPDGRYVAARDDTTGQIHLWDRSSRRSRTLQVDEPGRSRRDMSIAFSRDSRCLAVNAWGIPGGATRVALWDVATGQRVRVCPARPTEGGSGHLAFTPDGRFLIVSGSTSVVLWRLAPTPPVAQAGHLDEAWAVTFSREGNLLASGSDDEGGNEPNTIKLWDPRSGRLVRGWPGGSGTVSSLAFAPDGQTLASAHLDESGSVRLWNVATGTLLATLEGHSKRTRSVAFHPSGRWLASSSADGTARIWDVAERQCIQVLEGHDGSVQEVTLSPDGTTLATAGSDGTLRLWDFASGRPIRVFKGRKFMATAFSPDGTLLAAADEAGQVRLWATQSGEPRGTMRCSQASLNALAFTADGEALAAAGTSGRIQLWDVMTGQELLTLTREGPQVNGLAFSPDGSTLASCSHDGAVQLWHGHAPPGAD